ncbi:aminodeoxychorismate synthase component I [Hoyosella subflava]|uniref:Para-aminobenzoate synthase, subunit I n=1 Tax=Hoyosella subflava (strain DSM 45089 / JCM 17490 / NBRC 109087 / DQS3-9A1) TaxID=443218 RepID=F6ER67_HOYSD|nr:aminodeoxychorismate synthase component I [Hoyosella subflava]AEF41945.1 Para-aminobenzoate synthase, subunit I [Hoyosella subflava DQS3-9A1]
MRCERIGEGFRAADVLRALASRAQQTGAPPPAAVTGNWFGSLAIIAPELATHTDNSPHPFGEIDTVAASGDAVGGGWFGYLSYPDTGPDGTTGPLPRMAGGYTDSVLRLDRSGTWWFESLSGAACPDWLRRLIVSPALPPSAPWTCRWEPPSREVHRYGVEACLEAIRAGEVYQACVCGHYTGKFEGAPLDFFTDAITATQPSKAAFLQGAWGSVASLSPELFLSRKGRVVESSPIKGTLPIDADPALLRNSVKDVAENVMIVDLVRNDLGRLADSGSVTVTDLLGVYPAPGVWHLVSTVQAHIDDRIPVRALLEATFPPASVTGTPKHRARTLLQHWEPSPRGVYCGTVGFHSPIAGLELNVAIRTVEFTVDGQCRLGVGGGITIDSVPDREWNECVDKAATIVGLTPSASLR